MAFEEMFNGVKISRIWADAKDIDVCHYVVYTNQYNMACVDAAGQIPIGSEMLKDLYLKSLLVYDGGQLYAALSMSEGATGAITIWYAKVVNGSITIATVTSSENVPIIIPALTSLDIDGEVLTPIFSPSVFEYAMTTVNASNIVAFRAFPENTTVSMKLNDVVVADPATELTWATGANILTISLTVEGVTMVYTITVTKEAPPVIPVLASLDVGSKVLTPAFSAEVHEYAVTTADTSNLIAFTAAPLTATVAMTLNGEAVVNMEDAFVWVLGENIVTISLTVDGITTVYTITVTNTAE